MSRPMCCVFGIHVWQTVDYDHDRDRVTHRRLL